MIEFRTLGALELRGSDGTERRAVLTQPKRVALLAYLAVATPRGRFHRRDTLLGLFWPELDQDRARAALRQALHGLRQALGPDALSSRGDEEVGVNHEVLWCDACAFEDAIAVGDLEDSLEHYRGDFLEGFFLSGAADFDRWLEEQRAHLRRSATQAAGALIDRCESAADALTAAKWARRAAGLTPLDEAVVRRLIALLDQLGDRAGAVEVYERFAARIADELDVKPAPETDALIEMVRVREMARQPVKPPSMSPVRAANVAALPSPSPSRSYVTRSNLAAAAILAVAAVALLLRGRGGPELNADRVVVVQFANRTGDTTLDPLGVLAAEWITQGLSETGLVEVADAGVELPDVLGGTRQARGSGLNTRNASEAARSLALTTGSGVAVSGSYFRHGDSLEFAASVTDERRREVVRSLGPLLTTLTDPRPALAALRQRVIAALAVVIDPRLRDWRGRTSQPPSYAAYREFAAGVDATNRLDNAEALRLFKRATALDSSYTLPLVWAAFGYWLGWQCQKTEALGLRFRRDRAQLATVDGLLLERWVAQCHGDLPTMYHDSQLLVEALPGSELMAGYLGRDAVLNDRPREAIAILRQLHPDRGALRDWPYYFYWLTAAYHSVGEHERELDAARLQRRLNPGILGRHEAIALAALGRIREVNELLDALPTQRPHPWRTPAMVMRETALELRAHGYRAASDSVLDRTLAWLDGRPREERATQTARRLRLQTLFAAGRWEPARVLAEELAREHPDSLTYLGVRGALAAQRGDRREAAQANGLLMAQSRPFLQGYPSYWRACIAAQLGDQPRAVRLITQAHQEGMWLTGEFWEQPIATLHADPCFEPLHGYAPFQQLLRPKG